MWKGAFIQGSDPDSKAAIAAAIEAETRTLRINNWVWDTDAVAWIRMKQPSIEYSGDLTVTMGDVERLLAGIYWPKTKFDYDVDGNCIYKGCNDDLSATDGDTDWWITRFDYTLSVCNQKRVRKTSWTNRAVGW